MNSDRRVRLVGVNSKENKLATRVHRNSLNRSNADTFTESIVLPCESFVKRVSNAIRHVLVVGEKENGSLIAILPDMSVLVHLLPGESTIPSEESITVGIRNKRLADITDGEHEPDGGGRRVRRTGIFSFGVAVNVKSAGLLKMETVSIIS